MCSVLKVSRSGYYNWLGKKTGKRELKNQEIKRKIIEIHNIAPTFGLKPLHKAVSKKIPCSLNRLHRLKKELGIMSKRKRRYKATTNSRHTHPIADNLLKRDFSATYPNQKWVSDITYIPTGEGWLYLSMIKDLFTKEVVGWACSDRIDAQLTLDALNQAVVKERPQKGIIIHSDRGVQYASSKYQDALKLHNIRPSMSRKGDPYDNAVAENFFNCLKCEWLYLLPAIPKTRQEAKRQVFRYIEGFYNRYRLHSSIDYLSPTEFKDQYYENLYSVEA